MEIKDEWKIELPKPPENEKWVYYPCITNISGDEIMTFDNFRNRILIDFLLFDKIVIDNKIMMIMRLPDQDNTLGHIITDENDQYYEAYTMIENEKNKQDRQFQTGGMDVREYLTGDPKKWAQQIFNEDVIKKSNAFIFTDICNNETRRIIGNKSAYASRPLITGWPDLDGEIAMGVNIAKQISNSIGHPTSMSQLHMFSMNKPEISHNNSKIVNLPIQNLPVSNFFDDQIAGDDLLYLRSDPIINDFRNCVFDFADEKKNMLSLEEYNESNIKDLDNKFIMVTNEIIQSMNRQVTKIKFKLDFAINDEHEYDNSPTYSSWMATSSKQIK